MTTTNSTPETSPIRIDASGVAPHRCDADEARGLLASIATARAGLDALEAATLARLDHLAQRGEGPGGHEAAVLDGRRSGRQARNANQRAAILAAVPALAASLASGAVTAEHIDAYAAACRDLTDTQQAELLDEPELRTAAQRMAADPFRTLVRNRAASMRDQDPTAPVDQLRRHVRRDGTHVFSGRLSARQGAALFAAIDAEVDTLAQTERAPKNDTTAARALASLARRGIGAGPNTTPADVLVIDAATLARGRHDHTVCETESGAPVHPSSVERAMCHAVIMPALITTGSGQVLHLGRQVRVANRAQRRALRAMYASCAFPGCTTSFSHCQMHHITPWHQGGTTDLDNLLPLCSRHHHLVHEGRWRIELDADRTLQVHQPDGRLFKTQASPTAGLADALTTGQQCHQSGRPPDRPAHNRAA